MIKRRQRSLSVVHWSGDANGSVRPMMPRGWFQATEEGQVHHDVRLDGYLNHTQGLNIQHKLNTGKEKKIGPYLVDGYDSGSNTVYQFHGSYWHGHDCWLTKNVKDQKWREGRQSRYDKTIKTSTLIQTQSYRLVEKWECQFRNDMRHQNLSGGGIYPAAMFPGFRQRSQRQPTTGWRAPRQSHHRWNVSLRNANVGRNHPWRREFRLCCRTLIVI